MKKFLSLTLVFVVLLGLLVGCGDNTPPETLPSESTEKQAPQYHTKYFNTKMLEEQMSHTAAIEIEKENVKNILAEMNEGIIDTAILNSVSLIMVRGEKLRN
jgi:hypothetical protein